MGYGITGYRVARPSIILIVLCTSTCLAQLQFKWDVEPWSVCEHTSCGSGGRQYRKVWCKLMTGQPVVDENCEQDFRPAKERECIKSCAETASLGKSHVQQRETTRGSYSPENAYSDRLGRSGETRDQDKTGSRSDVRHNYPTSWKVSDVEWVVDQWSSCHLVPGAESCGRNSGMQHRNVSCERKDRQGRVSSSICEMDEPMPATSQSCELLCRQDCVVSTFSAWSGCDSTCRLPNQTRTRNVIVPPRHRGSHCPELSEMAACEKCSLTYTYKFSDWLPCSPIIASYVNDIRAHHLIGYQIRDISCLQSKGVLTSLSFCAKMFPHTTLIKHRACVMAQDCQVSAWSSMHPYNTSCIDYDGQIKHGFMIRTRQILQLPLGNGEPCPSTLVEYIKLNKEDNSLLRPCNRGKWIMSSWSLCQSVPGYNHCGTGIRTRRAVCVQAGEDGTERPVEDTHCPVPKPAVAQSCTMECSWDCSVSQWSAWSSCQESNCEKSDLRKRETDRQTGKKFRTREILTFPGPGGKVCPHLTETRMCEPQPCFIWNVTFGLCEATTRGGCGDGTQLKKAVCLNRAGEKVRDRFCHESLHTEQNWANCYVSCPEDCVISEWGQWSACPDPCLVQDGMRSRKRHILAYHGPGRKSWQCPSTNSLVQTEQCPAHYDCLTYQWTTSAWGPCHLSLDNPIVQCGAGIQNRTVECYTSGGVKAVNKCEESTRSTTIQSCQIDCPIDCHVTEWSEWSDCGIMCLHAHARHINPSQVRRRFILQYPQHGGLSCPSDLREEQRCSDLPVCQTYYWEITEWSDCILPPVVPLCGQGLRARNITCFQNDEAGKRQVSVSTCLEKLGLMPDMTEVCYIPCDSECQFSAWSPWTMCGPQCEKTRFRIRRLLDESKNNPECHDIELYPRDEHQECVCDSTQRVLMGGWSDCIIQSLEGEEMVFASMSLKSISARHRRNNETGMTGLGPQTYCGEGKRYKALSCENMKQNIHGAPVCTGEDYQEENCSISCPVDCRTTPWSTWSPCSSSCGPGVQQRERHILTMPQNGGRRCPFIYGQKETQTKVCSLDCNHNMWRMENWEPCVPSESRTCGEGTQRRIVRCVSLNSERTELMTVDDSFCSSLDKPQTAKPCTLPCPGECVLSEWSDWTACSQPCTGIQTQTRVRSVQRMPASYAVSQTCFSMKEERLCERWKNCLEYSWEFSDWTSCLVNSGDAECGVGHKERFPLCRKESNEKVDSYICEELFGQVTEPLAVSCEIPCDNDCLMSDWSDWTACSTTCGLGFTRRRRTILQSPIGNGRKCPERLDQSKPCFHKGCYRWFVSEWSHCIIQKGACGTGVQERNISCLNDEGRPVVSSSCDINPEIVIMQTSRPCHVPCPGECSLSEWSTWSDCFIGCEDFEQGFTLGVQARSRAVLAHSSSGNKPCNGTLWEDKACSAQHCSQFIWVTTDWDKLKYTRQVFCARDDGLRVIGGCDESQIPSRVLTCTKVICLHPAKCEDLDVCSCPSDEGFQLQPVNSTAWKCIMNSTGALGDDAAGVQIAKSPNIWMYAVIAIGTLFVIAVTAALYNMCELFRTGPRPRRKGQLSRDGSTIGVLDSVSAVHGHRQTDDVENQRPENVRKQHNHVNDEEGNLFVETIMSSGSSTDSHHTLAPVLSHDLENIPDTNVSAPTSSAHNLTSSCTLTTHTDPSKGTSSLMSQVGVVTYNQSDHVPKLPHKHNRRYKRIHRMLPSRVALCFACEDRSSKCMLDEPHDNNDLNQISFDRDHANPPTLAHGTTSMDICSERFHASNSTGFPNHNCMLSKSCDIPLPELDVPKHERLLYDINMTEILSIPLIDEIDCKIKGIPPTDSVSSTIDENSQRFLNSPSMLQILSPTLTLLSSEEQSQYRPTTNATHADDNSFSTARLQSIHHQRPRNFLSESKLLTATEMQSSDGKHLKRSLTNPAHGDMLPSTNLPCGSKTNVTNLPGVRYPTYQDSLGLQLSNAANFHSSHLHAQASPLLPHPVGGSACSICSPTEHKWTPHFHQKSRSKIDIPSPLSVSSDSAYSHRPSHESPHRSPHYRNIFSATKSFISPTYQGKNEDGKTTQSRILNPVTKISSSASLPENLINSTNMHRSIPPLLQKVSQDSGHSTIPQSQTASLEDYSMDASPDVMVRDSTRNELSPMRVQTLLESGQGSPASGLCDSCGHLISRSEEYPFLPGRADSTSQASNICGMETSV